MSESTNKYNTSFSKILPKAEEVSTDAYVNSCRQEFKKRANPGKTKLIKLSPSFKNSYKKVTEGHVTQNTRGQ